MISKCLVLVPSARLDSPYKSRTYKTVGHSWGIRVCFQSAMPHQSTVRHAETQSLQYGYRSKEHS